MGQEIIIFAKALSWGSMFFSGVCLASFGTGDAKHFLMTHTIHVSTYIWLIFMVNVGKYTIHGSYGRCIFFTWFAKPEDLKPTKFLSEKNCRLYIWNHLALLAFCVKNLRSRTFLLAQSGSSS